MALIRPTASRSMVTSPRPCWFSVNFCGRCTTTIYLDLERFPDRSGVFRRIIRRSQLVRSPYRQTLTYLHQIGARGCGSAARSKHFRGACAATRRVSEPADCPCARHDCIAQKTAGLGRTIHPPRTATPNPVERMSQNRGRRTGGWRCDP